MAEDHADGERESPASSTASDRASPGVRDSNGRSVPGPASSSPAVHAGVRRQRGSDTRSTRLGSTAVVHAGVLMREDRGVLVGFGTPAVDDLAEEQRVPADARRLDAPRSRGRRPPGRGSARRSTPSWNGKPFSVRASRSTSTGLVNLRTIARSSCVTRFTENARPSVDELVGERLPLDDSRRQLRVERHLRDPVHRHAVAALSCARAEHVETARHRPEHAAAELVVLLRIVTGGNGPTSPSLQWACRRGYDVRTRSPATWPARSRLARQTRPRAGDRAQPTRAPSPPAPPPWVARRGARRARRCGARSSARGTTSSTKPRARASAAGDPLAGDHGPSPAPRSCPRPAAASGSRRRPGACPTRASGSATTQSSAARR